MVKVFVSVSLCVDLPSVSSFQCAIYTCEAMERDNMKLADQYFTQLSAKHTAALDALMTATLPDPAILIKLTGWFILHHVANRKVLYTVILASHC